MNLQRKHHSEMKSKLAPANIGPSFCTEDPENRKVIEDAGEGSKFEHKGMNYEKEVV